MKTGLGVALLAHYAQDTTSLARLWKITRSDGVVFGITDHVEPITFESVTYSTTSSFDASANATAATMAVGTMELVGLLAVNGILAADIEAGRWDAAKVDLVEVNYRDLTMGCNPLRFGELGQVQRKGKGQYTFELRDLGQYLQNNLGRTVAAACDADFGDARCGVDKETFRRTGTVTAVTSNRVFTATIAGLVVDATYSLGELRWESGANDDLRMEVKSLSAGLVTLQLDMPYTVAVGNNFTIVPGCNKIGRLGHCRVVYDNYVNFRGFEDIPGQNKTNLVGGQ